MTKYQTSWWQAMIKRHGSEEAVRAAMRERQAKSRENYSGSGGFKYLQENNPEKLKEISKRGGSHAKAKKTTAS